MSYLDHFEYMSYAFEKNGEGITTEHALKSKLVLDGTSGGRGRGCGGFSYQGRRGRGSSVQARETQYGEKKVNVQCWNCKQYRNYTSDCSTKNDKMANFAAESSDSFDELTLLLVEGSNIPEEEPTLLVVGSETLKEGNIWYLDLGVSNHMCGRWDFFIALQELVGRTVS